MPDSDFINNETKILCLHPSCNNLNSSIEILLPNKKFPVYRALENTLSLKTIQLPKANVYFIKCKVSEVEKTYEAFKTVYR